MMAKNDRCGVVPRSTFLGKIFARNAVIVALKKNSPHFTAFLQKFAAFPKRCKKNAVKFFFSPNFYAFLTKIHRQTSTRFKTYTTLPRQRCQTKTRMSTFLHAQCPKKCCYQFPTPWDVLDLFLNFILNFCCLQFALCPDHPIRKQSKFNSRSEAFFFSPLSANYIRFCLFTHFGDFRNQFWLLSHCSSLTW